MALMEEEEKFLKRELNMRIVINNLQCNLTYGAILKLLRKYKEYNTIKAVQQRQPEEDNSEGNPAGTA